MKNKEPQCIRAGIAFNRKTLRKTEVGFFDNGLFQITSKILDKDTLKVTTITSHYTVPSMVALVDIINEVFPDIKEGINFDDFIPKSDMEN